MPSPVPPGNIRDSLRWSIDAASREFGVSKDWVKKRLIEVNEPSNPKDKCFSTAQIVKAIFGDIHGERLRETKEKADNWALKNAVMRGELLDRSSILRGMEHIITSTARLIDASSLSKTEKTDLRNTIATWPVVVRGVAERQSHEIALGKNGKEGGSEEEAED
jgi:phage terminase Nu1 subunit (DNA packaging protein)